MLNQYIQAPYIKTLFGLATPALIISVIYLLGLGFYLAFAQKKGKVEIRVVDACELMQGDRNKIILSVIGYVVFILACINLP